MTGNRNYLWSKFVISWKEVQGKGAMLVAVVPIPRALVDYERLDEVAKLQKDGFASRVLPPEDSEQATTVLQRAGAAPGEQIEDEEGSLRAANTYEKGRRRDKVEREEPQSCPEDRWRIPWMEAPAWMPHHLEQPHERGHKRGRGELEEEGSEAEERQGSPERTAARQGNEAVPSPWAAASEEGTVRVPHNLAFVGPMVYCTRCANFAQRRVGAGIKGGCAAPTNRRANAVAARLRRLQAGLHPTTGAPLV